MISAGKVLLVAAATVVVLLQGCLLVEGTQYYAKVSVKTAEDIADNAYCLAQAAYSVKIHIPWVS